MGLKRRTLLQQAGLTLAALGFSEIGLSRFVDRYQQALAQPTRRKLALLVGINQYPESVCDYTPPKGSALNGCLTDVELQQELLIHRFGFQPGDVFTLTNQVATRQGIEEAFIGHLIQQAAPGDLVLFHFSGLGSQIRMEGSQTVQNSLVPIDGRLPTAENPLIRDLLEVSLGRLLRALPTHPVITMLDTGYANFGRTVQGNLRIRSRPNVPTGSLDADLGLQERLLQLKQVATLSNGNLGAVAPGVVLPGVVLQASAVHQVAAEGQWNGFSAGLFTYALTQQLWSATPATSVLISFNQAANVVKQSAGLEQEPVLILPNDSNQSLPILSEWDCAQADGFIKAIDEEGRAALWLAGLPAIVLENAGASLFQVVARSTGNIADPPVEQAVDQVKDLMAGGMADATDQADSPKYPLLQVRSREGLVAKSRLISADPLLPLAVGQLVQESVRILPRNVSLIVALDPSLKRIERVDATSAFAAIPRVSSVIAGEQPADCLFGKRQPTQVLSATLPTPVQDTPPELSGQSSYGLFDPARDAIPNTLVQAAEAVKTAVHRMTAQLNTLLAIKLLRLTQNQGSSRLGVRVSLETIGTQPRVILQQETVRAEARFNQRETLPEPRIAPRIDPAVLTADHPVQYRLQNQGSCPIYFLLIGLDTKGDGIVYQLGRESGWKSGHTTATSNIVGNNEDHPQNNVENNAATHMLSSTAQTINRNGSHSKIAEIEQNLIAPGETCIIPPAFSANWLSQNSAGLVETHLIFSRAPFTQTMQALKSERYGKTNAQEVVQPMVALPDPLRIVQSVLQDLDQASRNTLPKTDIPADAYALDVNAWATLSFLYQIAEAT